MQTLSHEQAEETQRKEAIVGWVKSFCGRTKPTVEGIGRRYLREVKGWVTGKK